MAAWKQLSIVILLLAAAAFGWVRYFPAAPEILARWGIEGVEWARAAPEPEAARNQEGGQAGRRPATVVTSPVVAATINDKLSGIGTGRANASVSIKPYSAGRLTEVLVEPGARVGRGEVLARLDSEAEEIAADRARIALDDANARATRMTALRSTNTATAVQVTEAELAVENARLAVRDAELALERRAIVAPIAGIVGILPVEAGNYVTTDTQIAMVDDRSTIVVDFWVPERYAGLVQVGEPLTATSIARPNEMLEGVVSAVDHRLDEQSRTLLVQARISNTDDSLRAGMSFQVAMRFAGDTYPSVNPLAVQWGADGAFVWTVRNGVGVRVPVRIIQRNTENVLVAADLAVGDQVVTEGIHLVREGAELLIAGAEPAGSSERNGTSLPASRSGS